MLKNTAAKTAALAAVVLAGGVAYGAIPSSSGVINACYKQSGGALRVVDEGVACTKNESPLSWNQEGPQGDPGPAGGALAYAFIGPDNHVDEGRSSGITDSMLTVVDGSYCFDVPFAFENVLATAIGQKPAPYATLGPAFLAEDGEVVPGCTGEDVVVYLWTPAGDAPAAVTAPFYVSFN